MTHIIQSMQPNTHEGLEEYIRAYDINTFEDVLFAIRNMQRLTPYQSNYVYGCSADKLIIMIAEYKRVVDYLVGVVLIDDSL